MCIQCQNCQKQFSAVRSDAKYCSVSCRGKAARKNKSTRLERMVHLCKCLLQENNQMHQIQREYGDEALDLGLKVIVAMELSNYKLKVANSVNLHGAS